MATDQQTYCGKAPPKPSDFALWLYGATITKIELVRTWNDGGNEDKTTLTLHDTFRKDSAQVVLGGASTIIDFSPDYSSLCRLNESVEAACRAWDQFSKTHADKIAQFHALKNELGL